MYVLESSISYFIFSSVTMAIGDPFLSISTIVADAFGLHVQVLSWLRCP